MTARRRAACLPDRVGINAGDRYKGKRNPRTGLKAGHYKSKETEGIWGRN
jgi:hypothetical protein